MENDVVEIDLREIFGVLRKNLLIIILSAFLGGMLMFYVGTALINKTFESTTKIYVLNKQEAQTVTYNDLQTGTQLTKDYAELVTSRTVTTQVIANLDLQNSYEDMKEITPDELADMITVEAKQDTRVIYITVKDKNPMRAQDIANVVRISASKQIYDVMDIEAVNVVDYANLPEEPVSPNVKLLVVIGCILCTIIAVSVSVIIYMLDDTIKTPDDVERFLGLSVLASIPFDETMTSKRKGIKRRNKRKK